MLKTLIYQPVSWIYALSVRLRNFMFDVKLIKSTSFDTPVISIGNITVGGTGKTPHTELLVRLLQAEHRIAVLSRGYKRKTKGFVLATQTSGAHEIGDELRQIKQKFPNVIVAADESRVRGVRKIQEIDKDVDLILLDDAFQHRKITPGLSILLIDYNRPLDADHYLPYGNLRESPSQVHRAHVVIITKTPADIKPIEMRVISQNLNIKPYQSIFFTSLGYGVPTNVFHDCRFPIDWENIKKENWSLLVVAGIAAPQSLLDYLGEFSSKIEFMQYSDHHQYNAKDIELITRRFDSIEGDKKILITTEKDAMRFELTDIKDARLRKRMLYVPVEPLFLNEGQTRFGNHIRTFIRNAANDYKFYSTYKQHFD